MGGGLGVLKHSCTCSWSLHKYDDAQVACPTTHLPLALETWTTTM